jgi:coenzyme PQQ precursor peptide PqqA
MVLCHNGIESLEDAMNKKVWTRPEVKQVNLGCEINSYAPAEV